jgi:hypothetical protein
VGWLKGIASFHGLFWMAASLPGIHPDAFAIIRNQRAIIRGGGCGQESVTHKFAYRLQGITQQQVMWVWCSEMKDCSKMCVH